MQKNKKQSIRYEEKNKKANHTIYEKPKSKAYDFNFDERNDNNKKRLPDTIAKSSQTQE